MTAINGEPGWHEIEELLPWYAAGRLSRRDADRVEQALAGNRELARRYELVRRELTETIYLNETFGGTIRRNRCRRGRRKTPATSAPQSNAIGDGIHSRQRWRETQSEGVSTSSLFS